MFSVLHALSGAPLICYNRRGGQGCAFCYNCAASDCEDYPYDYSENSATLRGSAMSQVRMPAADSSALDDEVLITRVASRDSSALEQLYDRYARIVYATALRMLGNAELAEDIVQETFWRVWRRSTSFAIGRGQVAGWIFGIAHNLCIDELRRQRSRPTTAQNEHEEQAMLDQPDAQSDVVSAAIERERRRIILQALAQIPPEQREVLELAYFRGLSQSEIAQRLNSPIGTVKTRTRLALQKMRDLLHNQKIGADDLHD
jgi:RNA polymerase sigma-70 factor (ECF subfamily)